MSWKKIRWKSYKRICNWVKTITVIITFPFDKRASSDSYVFLVKTKKIDMIKIDMKIVSYGWNVKR